MEPTTSSDLSEGAPCWIGDADFADYPYLSATVVETEADGTIFVQADNSTALQRKKPGEVFPANSDDANAPEDHCGLMHLNEPTLLHSTRVRNDFGATYTWVGASQLLSVNPCQPVDGGEDVMQFYRNRTREVGEAEPHAYAVAEAACARLHRQQRVAILVSGESGAGKTEASRLVMQYLVWRGGHSESRLSLSHAASNAHAAKLREGVLASTTVLESLGNARMIANANSSRFGKHVLLMIEPAATAESPITVRGAHLECFLLERCRLTTIAPGERNFHALYQLLAGSKQPSSFFPGGGSTAAGQLAEGYGGLPKEFAYLCSTVERGLEPDAASVATPAVAALVRQKTAGAPLGLMTGGGSGEAASTPEAVQAALDGYGRWHEAMARLGVSADGEHALHTLLRAVLLLGELDFREGDTQSDPPAPTNDGVVSGLRGLLEEDVLQELLGLTIASPRSGNVIKLTDSPAQCRAARDSLAMALYQAAFDAVVRFTNVVLAPPDEAGSAPVGSIGGSGASSASARGVALLDVFGFEVLQTNSLEQLLINFTNEKLHEHFLKCTLREEERVYAEEGVGAYVPAAATGGGASPSPPPGSKGKSPASKNRMHADNAPLLAFLERKPGGLFSSLESVCKLKNGADDGFVRDLFAQNEPAYKSNLLRHPRNAAATAGRRALKHDEGFQLAHFHSAVQYDAHGFVSKNKDALNPSLALAVERQAARLWRQLAVGSTGAAPAAGGGGGIAALGLRRGGAKPPTTLSEGHRARLATLLGGLDPEASGVHNFFIKCVKPNERMLPNVFHGGYVLRQLRHQGVLQAVAIIKEGFPHRVSYTEVHSRYASLLKQLAAQNMPGTSDFVAIGPRGFVCALLAAEELTESVDYVLGRTRVFLRLGKAQLLEQMLSLPPEAVLPDLERRLQMHAARVRAKMIIRLALRRAAGRRRVQREKMLRAVLLMGRFMRRTLAKSRVRRAMRERAAAEAAAAAEAEAEAAEAEAAAVRAEEEARFAEAAAIEEEDRKREEAALSSVLPHMPTFLNAAAAAAEAAPAPAPAPVGGGIFIGGAHGSAAPSLPTDLALDPAVHALLFSHWDWAAPGAGEGVSGATARPRRALLAGRGPNSKAEEQANRRAARKARRADDDRALTTARLRDANLAERTPFGWMVLALLVSAYVVVAALPVAHWALDAAAPINGSVPPSPPSPLPSQPPPPWIFG